MRGTYVEAGRKQATMPTMPDSQPIVVDAVFTPQATVKEAVTPIDRSVALVIRLLPNTLIWLVLTIPLALAFNVSMLWALIAFALLTFWSYREHDAAERYDSATGVEHHRIDAAERLTSQKIEADKQVRMKILADYIKTLEGPTHDNTQTTQQSGRSLPCQ
jgi:hypothetical protein